VGRDASGLGYALAMDVSIHAPRVGRDL